MAWMEEHLAGPDRARAEGSLLGEASDEPERKNGRGGLLFDGAGGGLVNMADDQKEHHRHFKRS